MANVHLCAALDQAGFNHTAPARSRNQADLFAIEILQVREGKQGLGITAFQGDRDFSNAIFFQHGRSAFAKGEPSSFFDKRKDGRLRRKSSRCRTGDDDLIARQYFF